MCITNDAEFEVVDPHAEVFSWIEVFKVIEHHLVQPGWEATASDALPKL